MEKKGYLGDILIIIAGLFWGSMGIFVRHLNALGFTSIQVACLRLTFAGVLFAVILLIKASASRSAISLCSSRSVL